MRIVSFIALRTLLAGSIEATATAVHPQARIKASTGCRGSLQLECPNRKFVFRSPLSRLTPGQSRPGTYRLSAHSPW